MAEYRVRFIADTREAINNIANMRKLVAGITREFENAEIGSEEFIRSASNLSRAKSELKDYLGEVVNIDRAFNQAEKALDDFARANDRMVNSAIKANDKYEQILRDRYELEDYFRKKSERETLESFNRRLKEASATRARAEREQKILAEAPRSTLYDPAAIVSLERRLSVLREKARQVVPRTDEWNKVNAEARKLEQKIDRINKIGAPGPSMGSRLGAAGGAFLYGGGMGGGIGSMLGGVGGGLMAGPAGAFAGAAVGQAMDSATMAISRMTEQAANVQRLQRGLAMASVDAKDFAEAQSLVGEMSQRLLMPISETTRYFTQLRANTKEYNLSAADTAKIMEGTALAIRATGGTMDDLDGAMRAVVQIMSKGGVQAEELRGQLGERFAGAVVQFAKANKMTFEELQDGLQRGEIGVDKFITFAKSNFEKFGPLADSLPTSIENAGERMQIAGEQASIAIGSVFMEAGADIQNVLADTLNAIASFVRENEGELKTIANGLSSLVQLVIQVGAEITRVIGQDIFRAFQGLANAATTIRNLTGGGDIVSVAKERQTTSSRINEQFQKIADLENKAKNVKNLFEWPNIQGDLAIERETLKSLQKRREELGTQFSGMGGVAALNQATKKTEFTFGGPGAGMPLTREGTGAAGKDQKAKVDNLESFEKLRDQLAKTYNEAELNRIKQQHELRKRLQEDAFDRQEAGANRLQRLNLSLIRNLVKAEEDRTTAIREAQAEVQKAAENVMPSIGTAATTMGQPGGASGSISIVEFGKALQKMGYTVKEHPAFGGVGKHSKNSYHYSGEALDITDWRSGDWKGRTTQLGEALRKSGAATETFYPGYDPVGGHTSHLHAAFKGGRVPLTPGIQSLLGGNIGAGAPRKVGANEQRDTMAAAKTQIAQTNVALVEQDQQLIKNSTTMKAVAQYIQQAFNIPDLSLDNKLLKERNNLMEQGVDPNVIDYRIRLLEIDEQFSHLLSNFPALAKDANLSEEQRIVILQELLKYLGLAKLAEKEKNDETLRGIEAQKQREYDKEVEGLRTQLTTTGAGFKAGFIGAAGSAFEGQLQQGRTTAQALEIAKLTEQLTLAQTQAQALEGAVTSVSDAFANMLTTGVMSLIDGTATAKEVFVDFLKSIGSALMQAAQQMIAQYIAIGIARIFAGMGKAPGGGGGLPGFSMEGQLAGGGIFSGAGPFQFANGGIAPGGFKAFANGGVVNGPTLGLVGEGKYNEAIIPLPDGRSVPVKMQGEQSSRELLSSMTAQQKAPSLNLSFQTTTIGGVEYVSRDQLEQAMSETRRMAAKEGASRGASLALNRIANNPSDRRRAGIR